MKMEIENALSITGNLQSTVDEMLEMALISYPEDEELKKLVESRNEKIMRAFKPGKIAAALESGKDVMHDDEPINDVHISQEDNDTSTDDFFGREPYIDIVRETPEEDLAMNGGNKENDGSDGTNKGINGNGEIENEYNKGVDVELDIHVEEPPKTVESGGINKGGNGNEDQVLRELSEGRKSAAVGPNEAVNEIDEGADVRLDDESPGERTISQILVRLVNKGEPTRFPNVSIPVATEKALEGTETRKDTKRQYIDFTPPSFSLFSQDNEMNDTTTQPTEMETEDNHKSGVEEPKRDTLVTLFKDNFANKKDDVTEGSNLQNQKTVEKPDTAIQQTRETMEKDSETIQIDAVNKVQKSEGVAGASIQKNGEEPKSGNVIVDTFIQPKTNTRETFSKRLKVTKMNSEGLQRPGQLIVYTTGADKGEKAIASDKAELTPAEAISALPLRTVRPMEQGNEILGKRVSNPTEVLLSPYVKRKVSITTNLQSDEKAIVDFMFSRMLPSM